MRWLLLLTIICLTACNQDKIARLEKQNRELAEKLGRLEANSSGRLLLKFRHDALSRLKSPTKPISSPKRNSRAM